MCREGRIDPALPSRECETRSQRGCGADSGAGEASHGSAGAAFSELGKSLCCSAVLRSSTSRRIACRESRLIRAAEESKHQVEHYVHPFRPTLTKRRIDPDRREGG
jgi:hypothetical protein